MAGSSSHVETDHPAPAPPQLDVGGILAALQDGHGSLTVPNIDEVGVSRAIHRIVQAAIVTLSMKYDALAISKRSCHATDKHLLMLHHVYSHMERTFIIDNGNNQDQIRVDTPVSTTEQRKRTAVYPPEADDQEVTRRRTTPPSDASDPESAMEVEVAGKAQVVPAQVPAQVQPPPNLLAATNPNPPVVVGVPTLFPALSGMPCVAFLPEEEAADVLSPLSPASEILPAIFTEEEMQERVPDDPNEPLAPVPVQPPPTQTAPATGPVDVFDDFNLDEMLGNLGNLDDGDFGGDFGGHFGELDLRNPTRFALPIPVPTNPPTVHAPMSTAPFGNRSQEEMVTRCTIEERVQQVDLARKIQEFADSIPDLGNMYMARHKSVGIGMTTYLVTRLGVAWVFKNPDDRTYDVVKMVTHGNGRPRGGGDPKRGKELGVKLFNLPKNDFNQNGCGDLISRLFPNGRDVNVNLTKFMDGIYVVTPCENLFDAGGHPNPPPYSRGYTLSPDKGKNLLSDNGIAVARDFLGDGKFNDALLLRYLEHAELNRIEKK